MSTAVASSPVQRRIGVVDRENGVIYGVKVLGWDSSNPAYVLGVDSDNTYHYPLETVEQALPLYDGCHVNIDHRDYRYDETGRRVAPISKRTANSRFGVLRDPFITAEGLHADLYFLKSHEMAERVCEAVQRGMEDIFCLSHDADTVPEKLPDGEVIISRILEVRSVDIIAEKGGTTVSLFESKAHTAQGVTMPTATKPDQHHKHRPAAPAKTTEMQEPADDATKTQEMIGVDPLVDESPDEAMKVTEQADYSATMSVADALRALELAALADPEIDSVEAIKKIEKLRQDLAASAKKEAAATEEEDSDSTDSEEDSAATESDAAETMALIRHLEQAGAPITSKTIEAARPLWSGKSAKPQFAATLENLIEGWKAKPAKPAKTVGRSEAPSRPALEQQGGSGKTMKEANPYEPIDEYELLGWN